MARLATENVLTNVADRLAFRHYDHLHGEAKALEWQLRQEWRRPERLPVAQVLNLDALPDIAEAPGLQSQGFTAPRSMATGFEDGCFTECA